MVLKLKLVREEKLYRLFAGKKKADRLEASGVALLNEETALVIFDSLNLIACIDLSLRPGKNNRVIAAPSIGEGFEDIAWLDDDTLVAVFDQKKKQQPDPCAKKDQSTHIFRIPVSTS